MSLRRSVRTTNRKSSTRSCWSPVLLNTWSITVLNWGGAHSSEQQSTTKPCSTYVLSIRSAESVAFVVSTALTVGRPDRHYAGGRPIQTTDHFVNRHPRPQYYFHEGRHSCQR